jgi:hypothetical protein
LAAESFELLDQAAGSPLLVASLFVVVGPKILEGSGGVGEQVEDDDRDGPFDCSERFGFGHAPAEAPVALAAEGVGLGRPGGHLAKSGPEVRVALGLPLLG